MAAIRRRRRPPARDTHTLTRLAMLEAAVWDEPAVIDGGEAGDRARPRIGRELVLTAARLALCTALAYAAFLLLPTERGYWVALTVALVMKPDLGSVFARAVLRAAGTLGGALIAILVTAVDAGSIVLIVAVGLLAAALPAAMARSYALQAVFLTPLIMLMIGVTAPDTSPLALGGERILTATLGGVIVILAGYLPWRSARHVHVAARFEQSLRLLARYADAVADTTRPAQQVTSDRRAAYRSLSDARTSLQRVLSEPPPAGPEAWAWLPVVASAERVADHITDVSGSRSPTDVVVEGRALRRLADELAAFGSQADRAGSRDRATNPHLIDEEEQDPGMRELADEIAHLGPMLERNRANRAAPTRARSRRRVFSRDA